MRLNKVPINGVYNIWDQHNVSFPVYCDFGSEPGAAWTLIQSHTFNNNGAFQSKPFYLYDMSINQDAPDWSKYRLSMSRMKSIQDVSSHWRATCNFPTDGVDYRDYIRVSLKRLDLLKVPGGEPFCLLCEFVNVRGNECINCTVLTGYKSTTALHTDSWYGAGNGCEFDGKPGAIESEDNFGLYSSYNNAFRCTSSGDSTSQFWVGSA